MGENDEIKVEQLRFAKSVFKTRNVQLKIIDAKKLNYPKEWQHLTEDKYLVGAKNLYNGVDFYEKFKLQQPILSEKAQHAFKSLVNFSNITNPENTIFIISMIEVRTSWFEIDDNENWNLKVADTRAMSFPPYIWGERISKSIRGVITIQRSDKLKALAHELGHKLINVSHEGGGICPKAEVKGNNGLMVYGDGVQIESGLMGRWHLERLMRSPFLYTIKNKSLNYNKDFIKGGEYSDPIYGKYFIKPSCP